MARIFLNDTFEGQTSTPGEGRIFVNTWPPVLTYLNLAIEHYQRDLENGGVPSPTMRKEIILTPITPINSSLGLAQPNPAVQQYLGFDGFNDGLNLNTGLKLPADMISPLNLYQRTTGSNLPFTEMSPAPDGIPSVYQDAELGQWEWRTDACWWNGSINTMDVRLRYTGSTADVPANTAPSAFPTTVIYLQDSKEALALWTAFAFCEPRLPPGGAQELAAQYQTVVSRIVNRYVKLKQRGNYYRQDFGDDGGGGGWGPY